MATQEVVTADTLSTVFNNGDASAMAAAFAVPGSNLGGDAVTDLLINTKKEGASDFIVTVGRFLHMDVTGATADVAVPAIRKFKVHSKQITQSVQSLAWRSGRLPTAGVWLRGLRRKVLPSNRFEQCLHTRKR